MIGRFLETSWFLWWCFAAVIVGWWSSRFFADEGIRLYELPADWRNLYRQALIERDESKLRMRIQEAEGAILLELATHVFMRDGTERTVLQEALNNLYSLHQTQSERSDRNRASV